MSDPTPDRLAELRALEAAATEGPWKYYESGGGQEAVVAAVGRDQEVASYLFDEDAALVVALRNDAPDLIATAGERDRLRAEVERLRSEARSDSRSESEGLPTFAERTVGTEPQPEPEGEQRPVRAVAASLGDIVFGEMESAASKVTDYDGNLTGFYIGADRFREHRARLRNLLLPSEATYATPAPEPVAAAPEEPLCLHCSHRMRTHYDDGCIQCDDCRLSFAELLRDHDARVRAEALREVAEEFALLSKWFTSNEKWRFANLRALVAGPDDEGGS